MSDEMHFNKLLVTGRLCVEPQQRSTENGTNAVFFKIRETGSDNVWHCRAFDRIADFVLDRVEDDANCMFEGRLEQQQWEDADGNERRSISIRVNRVHLPVSEEHPVETA
jgi:single-stranded DNA-binding protein